MFLLKLVLFLLPLVYSTDLPTLIDHINNNLDVSVDPCDDFFLHVCSQSVTSSEFPFSKTSTFYESIATKFHNISQSRNFAILNDIIQVREHDSKNRFDRDLFEKLVRIRCKSKMCFRNNFIYFANFYRNYTNWPEDRLEYFLSRLNETNNDEILKTMSNLVESIYDYVFPKELEEEGNEDDDEMNDNSEGSGEIEDNGEIEESESEVDKGLREARENLQSFYPNLINRLFVMEKLQSDGFFEKIPDIEDDIKIFKELIIAKFRETPWLKEEDRLGLTLLTEFENIIKEMHVHYDLDESDRDLRLLRAINSKFTQNYYQAMRSRSTGSLALDVLMSLDTALTNLKTTPIKEVLLLIDRVIGNLESNAFYDIGPNSVAVLAPYLYPILNDNITLNKHYALFATITHEMFHSVVLTNWAEKSDSTDEEDSRTGFKNGMECYNAHFNKTCSSFYKGSCNSGAQTFHEDGPDLEGQRINYEFLRRNYNEVELNEIVIATDSVNLTRHQAFFYLTAVEYCGNLEENEKNEKNHTDVHSHGQVRVNGVFTQMPEFTKAFKCEENQAMYSEMGQTCHLFGPDSK